MSLSTSPMWPSTILVQAFYLIYGAMPYIEKGIYLWFDVCILLALCALPMSVTAIVGLETIAWLYNLPLRSEDKDKMIRWWIALNAGLFMFAFAGLVWSNHVNDVGASWKRLLLEADCVVLEVELVVVAIAAVVEGILVLVEREGNLAAALSATAENSEGEAEGAGEAQAKGESQRRVSERNRKTGGGSDC